MKHLENAKNVPMIKFVKLVRMMISLLVLYVMMVSILTVAVLVKAAVQVQPFVLLEIAVTHVQLAMMDSVY